MTEIKRQSFIDYVKGKKIKYRSWCSSQWFIPNGEFEGDRFWGKYSNESEVHTRAWWIENGIGPRDWLVVK